jgi:MoaA/NifB/PqqE/SkfB family radical SAM enzyme|tara:strand:+ start:324 stop:824 length:501 start_codon:yes stop_codon:yes gene_type:complete
MCSRVNMERSVGFMTIELFKKIIDESKDYAEIVHFAGGLGDPMLHPKFEQFINYAKINNVKVGLSTNATMLSDKNISKLIKDSPDVMFLSLDGFTKETHEKIRVGSNFEKTIKGVENYLKAKVDNNLQTYVVSQMVYMPINSDEAEQFKKKWANNPGINDVRLKNF